ncbi:RNA polymerase sigma factor [Pedobacter paludis]|uniref:RNA polymerase sigma-70 region 2 domain-containing protein n=1 Tax=Pedobacter paludis TaxID=2203212 RepID=A0A317F3Z2_9SPHI|nr:sigma-70 family RNA polymerase sigma factor [Pedobacter paludis]PWS32208.1 hypothetical protein DF947_10590 [Pedobacter paludis]
MENYANNSLEGETLIQKLNQGDPSAFTEYYNRYWEVLYVHARRLLGDAESARDTVQDVFTSLLARNHNFKSEENLRRWLYSCTKNNIISKFRKAESVQRYLNSFEAHNTRQECWEELFGEQLARVFDTAGKLADKMGQVFLMYHQKHMKRSDIAHINSVSELTVKSQIQSAMKIIRRRLILILFF